MHELILGGQKSGKSRAAEQRAASWLAVPGHCALLIATAYPGDEEMRARIARHQQDRARALPALATLEPPADLPAALREHSAPDRLLIVDCLTLWLTQLLMPPAVARTAEAASGFLSGADQPAALPVGLSASSAADQRQALLDALHELPGPVILVSNEISLGLAPMAATVRQFLDELGLLHQGVARCCSQVTLLVAGLELPLKRAALIPSVT